MTIKQKMLEAIGELANDCSVDDLYDGFDFLTAIRAEAVPSTQRSPLSVGQWSMTLITLAIPVLNFILYARWACLSRAFPR